MKISEPGACEAPGKHTRTNEDELDDKIVDDDDDKIVVVYETKLGNFVFKGHKTCSKKELTRAENRSSVINGCFLLKNKIFLMSYD